MNIGWLVLSKMRAAVRRLCGQVSGVPIGVADQSCARVNAPISPPPARKSQELVRKSSIQDNLACPTKYVCPHSQRKPVPDLAEYARGSRNLARLSPVLQTFSPSGWFRFICARPEQKRRSLRALLHEPRCGEGARNDRADIDRGTPRRPARP